MSATLQAYNTRLKMSGEQTVSPMVREVRERHLEGFVGLPTLEIVAAICKEFSAISHKEEILKYFLIESQLRARDLGTLLCAIGQSRATIVCGKAARTRKSRLALGKKPRWQAEILS